MQYEQPGCFGFVASFNAKSQVCRSCSFNKACAQKAEQGLSDLSRRLNVDAVKRLMQEEARASKQTVAKKAAVTANNSNNNNHSRKPASPMRERILSSMSAHVARAAGAVLDVGVSHRVLLLKGVNSMKGRKPASIELLFDLLLAGPVTRTQYLEALQERFGYTHATASSQASIGITAIMGIGIAKDAGDGSIVIRGKQ